MIAHGRRKPLLHEAERLADALSRFRTPNNDEPVDPSRLAEVTRFLRVAATVKELEVFLPLLPGSYLRKASGSAGPQLDEVRRQVAPLVRAIPNREELLYVLRWAQRLLATRERRPEAADRDGRPAAMASRNHVRSPGDRRPQGR